MGVNSPEGAARCSRGREPPDFVRVTNKPQRGDTNGLVREVGGCVMGAMQEERGEERDRD